MAIVLAPAALAVVHMFPATKHLRAFVEVPSWGDGWKGIGAAAAVLLLALWRRARVAARLSSPRGRDVLLGAALVLTIAHVVPASEHLQQLVTSRAWADAWRGFGAAIAVVVFARAVLRGVGARGGATGIVLIVAAFASSCAAAGNTIAPDDADAATAALTDASFTGGEAGELRPPVEGGSAPPGETLLYAHTDTTLFAFDPKKLAGGRKTLGTFDCVGASGQPPAMTDIGVSKDGKLFGVSAEAAYPLTVSAGRVHCDATWPLPPNTRFYGLTVAPENTVRAEEVVLASNDLGELFEIDATTGATTQVGTLGKDPITGKRWSLSGDIVLLANDGAPIGFATVRTCAANGGSCTSIDTLIELDPAAIRPGAQSVLKTVRGQVVRGGWCTNTNSPQTFGSMFGIAAFNDKVYGFSRKGDVVEIDNADGTGCLVAAYTTDHFAGAGVTTKAPAKAPPPK